MQEAESQGVLSSSDELPEDGTLKQRDGQARKSKTKVQSKRRQDSLAQVTVVH